MLLGNQLESNGKVGKNTPIRDAVAKVTGQAKYTGDLKLPRMLYGKMLFSPHAHAKIVNIDTSEAEALPGVRAVVCYKNSPDVFFNSCGEDIDGIKNEKVFDDTVRFVGDKVAAVAADTQAIADKAVKLIKVEYEQLPFNLDPEKALDEDTYPIHEGGNLMEVVEQNAGDCEAAFAKADRVYEGKYILPAIHHSAIETHAAVADYDADGKLTVYSTSQDVFAHRINLSRIFGIPQNKVRCVVTTLGGGFGGKIDMVCEPVASLLAIKTGRPVKLQYTRGEDIPSSRTRHNMVVNLKMGVMNDGTIVAQDYNIIVNAGAYASGTSSVTWAMCGKLFRIQKTPNIHFKGTAVYTNRVSGGAMRGFGSPQEFFAQQRLMNEIAKDLNLDITEFNLKNLMDEDGKDPRWNSDLGSTCVKQCVSKGRELFGWEEGLKEMEASAAENGRYRIGVGMAVAAHGNGVFGVHPDTTGVSIKMNEDGSASFTTGVSDMGNGSVTAQTMFIADILGLPMDKIAVVQADTESTMFDLGNYSSRGTFVSAHAAAAVAQQVADKLIAEACEIFEEEAEDIYLENEQAISRKSGKSASLMELVSHARHTHNKDVFATDTFCSIGMAMSYGAHFVKVQVDTETGEVKPLDYVAFHDVGTVVNPMNIEGQIEGAVQMGLGYALSEGIEYDAKGKITNANFRRYRIFNSTQMPPIRIGFTENSEPCGPYGAKSIGECSTVPAVSAITNAVSNAVGCDFHQVPLKPEVIKAALAEK